MTDDTKLPDAKTPSARPTGSEAANDETSPQHKTLEQLPGAGPPSDDEAEGEGDGTLDKE